MTLGLEKDFYLTGSLTVVLYWEGVVKDVPMPQNSNELASLSRKKWLILDQVWGVGGESLLKIFQKQLANVFNLFRWAIKTRDQIQRSTSSLIVIVKLLCFVNNKCQHIQKRSSFLPVYVSRDLWFRRTFCHNRNIRIVWRRDASSRCDASSDTSEDNFVDTPGKSVEK